MAGAAIVAAALARGLMPMGVLRVREGRTPDVYARRKTAIKKPLKKCQTNPHNQPTNKQTNQNVPRVVGENPWHAANLRQGSFNFLTRHVAHKIFSSAISKIRWWHARGICPCGVQVRIWLKPLIVFNTVLYLKFCWNKVCQNHFAHYYGNFIRIKMVNCNRDAGFSFREVWDKEVS